jgi:hypothetical protein
MSRHPLHSLPTTKEKPVRRLPDGFLFILLESD